MSTKIIGFILGASMGYAIAVFILKFIIASLRASLAPWKPFLCAMLMGFLGIFLIKTFLKSILFLAGFFSVLLYSPPTP